MHTIELPHINKTVEIPEYLGEFSTRQYLEFCKLMVDFLAGKLDYGTFRIHLLYKLLDMEPSKKHFSAEAIEQRNENIFRLSLLIDDYFEDTEVDGKVSKSILLLFVDAKIPYFSIEETKYYAPADALSNITFGEYREAINHYKNYIKTKDEHSLNMLVATLYREHKLLIDKNIRNNFNGDERIKFVSAAVTPRATKFKNLSAHIKYGVFLFFQACQNYITTAKDVEIEGNTVDLSVLFNSGSDSDKSIGLSGLLFSLAETKVFGNAKETDKELLWNILLRLVQNNYEAERIKNKQNATTT